MLKFVTCLTIGSISTTTLQGCGRSHQPGSSSWTNPETMSKNDINNNIQANVLPPSASRDFAFFKGDETLIELVESTNSTETQTFASQSEITDYQKSHDVSFLQQSYQSFTQNFQNLSSPDKNKIFDIKTSDGNQNRNQNPNPTKHLGMDCLFIQHLSNDIFYGVFHRQKPDNPEFFNLYVAETKNLSEQTTWGNTRLLIENASMGTFRESFQNNNDKNGIILLYEKNQPGYNPRLALAFYPFENFVADAQPLPTYGVVLERQLSTLAEGTPSLVGDVVGEVQF